MTQRKAMTQYLMAIYLPDDFDGFLQDKTMERDIDGLNEELVAAGVQVFRGGLLPVSSAKSLRAQPGGRVLITDGPYLEAKEHTGGFCVVKAPSEAIARYRSSALMSRLPQAAGERQTV